MVIQCPDAVIALAFPELRVVPPQIFEVCIYLSVDETELFIAPFSISDVVSKVHIREFSADEAERYKKRIVFESCIPQAVEEK